MNAREPEFPEHFGPFVLLRQLGVGGMGTAYLAMHAESQRLIVLKRMHPELLADPSIFKRFVHEAEVASHVRHANVASLVAMGAVDKEPFLATEYVFGIQVSQIVDRVEHAQIDPIPVGVALHFALGIAAGVEAIHGAVHRETGAPLSLIHRDIGARNVLVGFDGRVRIIDLGLGKSILSDWQTAAQVLAGSPDYMPPEQAMGARVDGRADVYSAAVTAWELLAGKKRIREEGVAARLSRALNAEPEPLLIHRPDASKRLEALLMQAMDPEPDRRTPRAEMFRRALAEELERSGGATEAHAVAWLDAACATVIAKEKRMLAEVRAKGQAFVGSSSTLAKTEMFVGRPALEIPTAYDFYADPERTLPPKARGPARTEVPTQRGPRTERVERGSAADARDRPDVRGDGSANDSVAKLAALVDPDTFRAQPPHIRLLLVGAGMLALILIATVTAVLFRPGIEPVRAIPVPPTDGPEAAIEAPIDAHAAGKPDPTAAEDAVAPGSGDTDIQPGGENDSEGAGANIVENSENSGVSPPPPEPARLTPELAAKKADLVAKIRQLRRTRFDVDFQRRLTGLSTRLSRARSAKALEEIEGALRRMERET